MCASGNARLCIYGAFMMFETLIRGTTPKDRIEKAAASRGVARVSEGSVEAGADSWHYAEPSRAQVVLPRDRQGTTINIIWGDRERLPDVKPRNMPGALAFALKALATIAFIGAISWGPSYYSCRQMKERGMFYYGTTISSCMSEKIEARNAYFETLGRKLIPAL